MVHGEKLSKSKPLGFFHSGREPFTSSPKAEIHRLAGGHFTVAASNMKRF
jgi:hypothetical protein